MGVNAISLITISSYVGAIGLRFLNLSSKLAFSSRKFFWLVCLAVILHGYLLYRWIDTPSGQNLSISHMFSLICWLISILALFSALKDSRDNLLLSILPLSGASILFATVFPGHDFFQTRNDLGSLTHILISIFAFGTLGIAALQAILLYSQNYALRHKTYHRLTQWMPPLQTMESQLFQLIWPAFLLLTASLCSAFIFFDQKLVSDHWPKSVLSLFAWTVLAIILYRHHQSGLRGSKATRWTFMAAGFLVISYLTHKMITWNVAT